MRLNVAGLRLATGLIALTAFVGNQVMFNLPEFVDMEQHNEGLLPNDKDYWVPYWDKVLNPLVPFQHLDKWWSGDYVAFGLAIAALCGLLLLMLGGRSKPLGPERHAVQPVLMEAPVMALADGPSITPAPAEPVQVETPATTFRPKPKRFIGTYDGRLARKAFWYRAMALTAANVTLLLMGGLIVFTVVYYSNLDDAGVDQLAKNIQVFTKPLQMILLFLWSSVIVRRLHDTGRTGWWYLLVLTGIGIFVLIYWFTKRGTPGPNKYGPDPLVRV